MYQRAVSLRVTKAQPINMNWMISPRYAPIESAKKVATGIGSATMNALTADIRMRREK